MRTISDQVLAQRMLQIREDGGYRFGTFLRTNGRKHVFVALYFIAALALFAAWAWWTVFALVLGMVLGMYLRDFGWIRSSRKGWPFTNKVVDWDLIQKMAATEQAG